MPREEGFPGRVLVSHEGWSLLLVGPRPKAGPPRHPPPLSLGVLAAPPDTPLFLCCPMSPLTLPLCGCAGKPTPAGRGPDSPQDTFPGHEGWPSPVHASQGLAAGRPSWGFQTRAMAGLGEPTGQALAGGWLGPQGTSWDSGGWDRGSSPGAGALWAGFSGRVGLRGPCPVLTHSLMGAEPLFSGPHASLPGTEESTRYPWPFWMWSSSSSLTCLAFGG